MQPPNYENVSNQASRLADEAVCSNWTFKQYMECAALAWKEEVAEKARFAKMDVDDYLRANP